MEQDNSDNDKVASETTTGRAPADTPSSVNVSQNINTVTAGGRVVGAQVGQAEDESAELTSGKAQAGTPSSVNVSQNINTVTAGGGVVGAQIGQAVDEPEELPMPWRKVQSAIWLVGLAILFWQGWIWPGILVLVAISGLTQVLMQAYVNQQKKKTATADLRKSAAEALPSTCPTCGAALSAGSVLWDGPSTAKCPYCKSKVPLK